MPMRWRIALISTFAPVTGSPSKKISPESGSSSRLQHRSIVDFPEPDGPKTKTSSLCSTKRSTFLRAWNDAKYLLRPRTSSEGGRLTLDAVFGGAEVDISRQFPKRVGVPASALPAGKCVSSLAYGHRLQTR